MPLTRRSALGLLGAAVVTHYAHAAKPRGGSAPTPAVTEGPFWEDDSAQGYNRTNIRSDLSGANVQAGVPLTLRLQVRVVNESQQGLLSRSKPGSTRAVPCAGARVDIWHCNAVGWYSDVPEGMGNPDTTRNSWLRGYQIADASGWVMFGTIIPGWYEGRTTHLHLRVRSAIDDAADGDSNTTQLFFSQPFLDALSTSITPYGARGKNPLLNVDDDIFQACHGSTVLLPTGNAGSGYHASATLELPFLAGSERRGSKSSMAAQPGMGPDMTPPPPGNGITGGPIHGPKPREMTPLSEVLRIPGIPPGP